MLLLAVLAVGAVGWMLAALFEDRDHQGLDSSKLVGRANVIGGVAGVLGASITLAPLVRRRAAQEQVPAQRRQVGTAQEQVRAQRRRVGEPLREALSRSADRYRVHPAISAGTADEPFLTAYGPREHDRRLRDVVATVVAGESRLVVLVGGSSTGKTRACWEALRELVQLADRRQGWWLWRPADARQLIDELTDAQVDMANTVVWLDSSGRVNWSV